MVMSPDSEGLGAAVVACVQDRTSLSPVVFPISPYNPATNLRLYTTSIIITTTLSLLILKKEEVLRRILSFYSFITL